MITLVLLSTQPPSKLATDLERAGYKVFEAVEVAEVLHLCEHHNIDAIAIGADVEDPDLIEVRLREIIITLKPEATAKDLIAELWRMFPDKQIKIQ